MTQIVNTDKLNLVLTDYGLGKIAEAMKDPTLNIVISKIRLGSGNNNEYYEPSSTQTSLRGDLGLEFFIYDKELLEDGTTISFHTVIPETVGNFDIREVGLYETIDGEDKLFAISTQQPFVKPSAEYFYFISIDYYMFLKNVNFAEIYEQIILDPLHALPTEKDLESLMQTFLFAQGNLIDQIGNNSTIIGYNRASQLHEKITENQKSFSYITLFKNFSSLMDIVSSPKNIFSYWAFDYSNKKNINNSIMDLSTNGYYLATNKALSDYEKVYKGFMSTLAFTPSDSFNLSSQIPLNLYNEDKKEDSPFTMIFALEPLKLGAKRTLIAKSNYATSTHSFEISELANRSLEVKLFSSTEDFLTFSTLPFSIPAGCHSIVLTFDPDKKKMIAYINSTKHELLKDETGNYTHINESAGTLYGYSCSPEYAIYTNSSSDPTKLYNADGSPYTGTDWTIEDNSIKYKGDTSTYTASRDTTTSKLYAWVPTGASVYENVIYTKSETITSDTILYKENYEKEDMATSSFSIAQSGSSYVILYQGGQTERYQELDVEPINIYCFKYALGDKVIYTNNATAPTILYNEDGSYYTGNEWRIEGSYVYFNELRAIYNPSYNKETFTPNLTSYITDENNKAIYPINANVGIISIIKEKISNENLRLLALIFCATMGKNPYLGGHL